MKTINQNEEGQGLVEYALVLVMVAVTLIVILTLLGSQVVLAYGRVIAGLNGDSLNDNAVLLSSDTTITGTTVCNATMENIRFIATDAEGNLITRGSVTVTIRVNGVAGATITGDANSSGIVAVAGPVSVSGGCPLDITLSS